MPNQKRLHLILRLNLALAFLEGLLVLWSFLREPSEPQSAVLFGFSYFRLLLIITVLSISAGFLILFLRSFREAWQDRSGKFLTWVGNQRWILWAFMLWLATAYILLGLSDHRLGSLASYRERVLPILLWLIALTVQFGFVLLYQRGINLEVLRDRRSVLWPSLAAFVLFGLVLLIIKLTGVGLTPDSVYWQELGAPVLLHQVLLAACAGLLFYFFIERTRPGRSTRLDLVVFLGLWALTAVLWLNQPANLTYFSLGPTEPNFQTYPFSDALLYDSTAQEFLIGKPIPGDFWVKPFYALFLALLHLFSGENYTLLVSLQVAVLAMIPSLAYLLTTALDRRAAGIVAALLIMIRERNAIALANVIQVSHSKLLLSDVFAMGEMILLVWLIVRWLQRPVERRATPIAAGGMLGILILTRGHPIVLFPFILLVSFIVLKPNLKLWSESSLRITLGVALVLLPWFWHIYQLTGRVGFQDPASLYAKGDWLVQTYAESPGTGIDLNSESSPSYGSFQSQMLQLLIERPAEVAGFVSAHYFHNAIFSYIYLPGSFQIEDLRSYINRMPFWDEWNGSLPPGAGVLLVLNLAVLALGIGAAWRKANGLVFAPLILGAAYNLSLAISRRSGWRFIVPADWVTLVFYAIGLVELVIIVRAVTQSSPEPSADRVSSTEGSFAAAPLKQSAVLFSLSFFLIAILLVQGHRLFPARYVPKSADELLQDYRSAAPVHPESAALERFLQRDGTVILQGRALYPVYLKANAGKFNYYWLSYTGKPYDRLAFHLIGPQSVGVTLPLEAPPDSFPAGSDVIVIGCRAESGEVIAMSVLIRGDTPIQYFGEPFPAPTCSLPTP